MLTVLTDTDGFIIMAKKSHKARAQRAISISPKPNANLRLLSSPPRWQFPRVDLRLFEDRRSFHPNKFISPARSIGPRSDARLMVQTAKRPALLSPSVVFNEPRRILICVRRNVRKEVLHALNKAGAGSGRKKKHRTQFSDVSC